MTAFDADRLEEFGRRLVGGLGAPPEVAEEVARHLVRANLAGHDSHGIIRIGQYAEQAEAGDLIPSALPTVAHEAPGGGLVDAGRGFGQYSTMYATRLAIDAASRLGVGAVAIRRSMHIGRVGEYVEAIMAAGQLGIVTVGSGGPGVGGMNVPGTSQRFFGANPWTFGMPGHDGGVLVDISTATVAEGKVRVARDGGAALKPGSIVDSEGRPTTDPEDFYRGGSILPLGGEVAGHKGYGLALASMLFGALSMIDDEDPTMIGASSVSGDDTEGRAAGVLIVTIDPAAFGRPAGYRELVDEVTARIRSTPVAPGAGAPIIPGEPESATTKARRTSGIELPDATVQRLNSIAAGVDVAPLGSPA